MKRLDGDRIRTAIDAAERGTTGRIGVRIVSGGSADALEDARKHFAQARLHEHAHRNGVVFFVAPKARRFAVFGDEAIHDRVGEAFWTQLVHDMTPYFRSGEMTEGLVFGITRVGAQLHEHFADGVPA
ncbi:MAG TPA: TPM domain-containing protein [Candidatus Baltobacteraceae bacterium]|nr:TPM domain-containing protein [Candidatus Baltobacteraceae bacterium]